MGLRRHVRADPGRGVLRPERNQDTRRDGARPVLRRCRSGPDRLPGMRVLHDRMPLRRQEHAGEELSRPRGIGWGASTSDDDGHPVRAATRRALGGSHQTHRPLAASQEAHVHRESCGAGRRHVQHAEAAVQDARHRHVARPVGSAGCADPHQLRIDRRCRDVKGLAGPGLDPRCRDHVVDSPDIRHSRRTRPLRQGLQRHGSAADVDDRRLRPRGHGCAAMEAVAESSRRRSARHHSNAQSASVERAHGDRTGDAAPGQLDHHVHQTWTAGPAPLRQQAGARRAEPDLDSGRQRSHPSHRCQDRRGGRRHLGRAVQHPADRALPRWRGDRRQRRAWRDRPVSPGVRLPDAVGGRRCGDLGEPRASTLSLSISAQAERAASLWPNKGENDLRPRQGEAYRRLDPIAPQHPVVPADAPGALRWLPIEPISSAG